MVEIEHKRSRLEFTIGKWKFEYTIEPRYWRNPLISVSLLALLPLIFIGRTDLLTLVAVANIYACIAIPLGWQTLGTGRLNFGPQFFVGIGGFTAGLLSIHLGWGPWQTLPVVIVAGFVFALAISPIVNIAKGLYFSLITLILPLIFLEITYVYTGIFRGEYGLSGIKPLFDLGTLRANYMAGAYLTLAIALLFLLIVDKVLRSRIGLIAAGVNDDEDAAATLGLNVARAKIISYIIPSVMISISGWLIAHYFRTFAGITYLPLSFMLKVLLMMMIGGRGEIYGAMLGAYFVAGLEKSLSLLGDIHHVLFPAVLLILLVTLPEGLYGIYRRHKYREYYPKMRVRQK